MNKYYWSREEPTTAACIWLSISKALSWMTNTPYVLYFCDDIWSFHLFTHYSVVSGRGLDPVPVVPQWNEHNGLQYWCLKCVLCSQKTLQTAIRLIWLYFWGYVSHQFFPGVLSPCSWSVSVFRQPKWCFGEAEAGVQRQRHGQRGQLSGLPAESTRQQPWVQRDLITFWNIFYSLSGPVPTSFSGRASSQQNTFLYDNNTSTMYYHCCMTD